MSQHDYVLDNASGAAFRSDLNNALLAVASLNSGASEPSTTYAYMFWYDTTNNVLKQRNAANNAWVTINDGGVAQLATKTYVDALLGANDAMVFKGVIDCSANPNYPAADAGHVYKVSVAGKIGGASGTNVEVGDSIYCITDSTASGTQAGVGANWVILQTNVDGAVTGPASSTSANIPTFNGTTGKVIQDSGKAFSTDGTLAGNSDNNIPTQKAVKTYVDGGVSKGWNLIKSQVVSGTPTELSFMPSDGVTIDSTYDAYVFVWENMRGTSGGVTPSLRVSTDGTTMVTTGTPYQVTGLATDGAGNQLFICDATSGVKASGNDSAINGELWMHAPAGSIYKHFKNQLSVLDNGGVMRNNNVTGWYNSANAILGVKFYPGTIGTHTWVNGGRVTLYGVKHS